VRWRHAVCNVAAGGGLRAAAGGSVPVCGTIFCFLHAVTRRVYLFFADGGGLKARSFACVADHLKSGTTAGEAEADIICNENR